MAASPVVFLVAAISAPSAGLGNPFLGLRGTKRKGPQLALEPLNGRGIAGYVPKPKLWRDPRGDRAREESYML
jgi:hypothetical protein